MKAPTSLSTSTETVNTQFRSMNPDHKVILEYVNLNELEIDPDIQRGIETPEVNHIVANFNPAALGAITVSARYNDQGVRKLYVVDGQQRTEASKRVNFDEPLRAFVHYGLSKKEEAQLFLDLNYRRSVNAWSKFKARRTAEDPLTLQIWGLLEELKIPVTGNRGFTAISTAEKIAKQSNGLDRLRWAVTIVRDVYDDGDGGVYDGRVIEAFSMIYAHYGTFINVTDLKDKLASAQGGIKALIGHGQTNKQVNGGHIATGIANAILSLYNKYRRADAKRPSRLPSLGTRQKFKAGSEAMALADVDTDE